MSSCSWISSVGLLMQLSELGWLSEHGIKLFVAIAYAIDCRCCRDRPHRPRVEARCGKRSSCFSRIRWATNRSFSSSSCSSSSRWWACTSQSTTQSRSCRWAPVTSFLRTHVRATLHQIWRKQKKAFNCAHHASSVQNDTKIPPNPYLTVNI